MLILREEISEQSVDIIGGRLKQFASQWYCITSDPVIPNSVTHYKIEVENGQNYWLKTE